LQRDAVKQSSTLEKQKQKEAETPTQKKSPWKKLLPHRHGRDEREPGKISTDRPHEKAVATTVPEQEEDVKDEVEITPTGATMAGDGPATIAAPAALPETEAAIDAQVTTPIEEREQMAPISAGSHRTTTEESEDAQASPSSPSKKRFSRLMDKLKRSGTKRDKKDDGAAETGSFTGGAKLHKQRRQEVAEEEEVPRDNPTPVIATVPATSAARLTSSPSVSSLSSSAEDDNDEEGAIGERGRSTAATNTRLDQVARQVADIKDSGDDGSDVEDGEDNFEEAYDGFNPSGLAPPRGLLSRKTESPLRDSKFREEI
jgi:hypothetical protein